VTIVATRGFFVISGMRLCVVGGSVVVVVVVVVEVVVGGVGLGVVVILIFGVDPLDFSITAS